MESPRFECQSSCEDHIRYLETIVEDLVGYMLYATTQKVPLNQTLMTVAHDLGGIYRKDRLMMPRSKGYKKYLKEN